MADNFLQAINTGINLGHMADSAKMQRAQMERMAAQMQLEGIDRAIKLQTFMDTQTEKANRKTMYAPEQRTITGEMGPSGELVGGGDEYGVTGPTESITMGPGRAALRASSPDNYNILADQMLNFGKVDPGLATMLKPVKPAAEKSKLVPLHDAKGNIIGYDLAGPGYVPPAGASLNKPIPDVKGFDTLEEAIKDAKRIHASTPDSGSLIPTAEMGPQGKYIPKLVPNIELRIPAYSAAPGMAPGWTLNRKTGQFEYKEPPTVNGKTAEQSALDWQAIKKAVQTTNSPTFKRLVNNAEILAVGVVDPKTGQKQEPEIDQIVKLRNAVDDKLFSKINNDLQAFNRWDQWLSYQTSDPKMAKLLSKVMAATDTLGSIYAGGGTVTSDFKMKFARELFETGLARDAFKAKMDTHKESILDRAYKFSEVAPAMFKDTAPSNPTNQAPTLKPTHKWVPGKGMVAVQ